MYRTHLENNAMRCDVASGDVIFTYTKIPNLYSTYSVGAVTATIAREYEETMVELMSAVPHHFLFNLILSNFRLNDVSEKASIPHRHDYNGTRRLISSNVEDTI